MRASAHWKELLPGFGISIQPVTTRKVIRESPAGPAHHYSWILIAGEDGTKLVGLTVGDPIAHGTSYFFGTLADFGTREK